jgi:peptidoglycan LD-endopeptidase CwlK
MPTFSENSQQKLLLAHKDLQTLFNEVIKYFDCTVMVSVRSEIEQNKAFEEGKSKLRYPLSKHNTNPSNALDVAPYPINWVDKERLYYFGGFVMGIAKRLKEQGLITSDIRYGGDWDGDTDLHDQTLFDLVHFEIAG